MRIPQSKQDKGFTLIELLVVVVIIGILAAIAIPVFLNQREKAAEAAIKSDLKNAATVFETQFVDEQTYAGVVDGDLQESPNVSLTIFGTPDNQAFCIDGTSSATSTTYYYDSDGGGLKTGTCASGSGSGSPSPTATPTS